MSQSFSSTVDYFLGFDPGRDKCGVAVVDANRTVHWQAVVPAPEAIATIQSLQQRYDIQVLVMGNQTTAKQWQQRLEEELSSPLSMQLVDERYSTLQARDRYWQMFPPTGFAKLIPQGMRDVPRPIDDIVAILLVERYLAQGQAKING
jgi:RNase H-fold protein (predicted Holliday junction resolvase)